ncbi:MAG: ribonuclease III [Bryobacter sp.]|nr:ribonuclease III [Bryobacter sp.]
MHLEARIGYHFRDKRLAVRALSHRSLNSERRLSREELADHNEQLEFLGDAVLGLLVSEHLFKHYPEQPEGKLSVLKARLVSAANLVEVARRLELGQMLVLGRGEELSGGREKKALLADAVEAILGAVYLDGGLEAARGVVERVILAPGVAAHENEELENYKALLQERAQAEGLPQPVYVTVATEGPEHDKTFFVEVRMGPGWEAQGSGSTKKAASQGAARLLYERLVEALERAKEQEERV